jgi:glycosyl transferase family 25
MSWLIENLKKIPNILFYKRKFRSAAFFQYIFSSINKSKEATRYYYFLKNASFLKEIAKKNKKKEKLNSFLINRKKDTERLAFFKINAKKINLNFERFEAVNAISENFEFKPYKKLISNLFYGQELFPRGSIGCFLSHYKVWEKIIQEGLEYSFVFEDDAFVLENPESIICINDIPRDADLIYMNHRMSEALMNKDISKKIIKNKKIIFQKSFDSVNECLKAGLHMDGVGADGYLITLRGAKKIVNMFNKHPLCMNQDWTILINSFSDNEFLDFCRMSGKTCFVHNFSNIHSYVIVPALVQQRKTGSVIAMADRKNMISYNDMFS